VFFKIFIFISFLTCLLCSQSQSVSKKKKERKDKQICAKKKQEYNQNKSNRIWKTNVIFAKQRISGKINSELPLLLANPQQVHAEK